MLPIRYSCCLGVECILKSILLCIRASVHATANHVSKLSVKILGSADPVLQTKLRHGPNEWQTWGQFLYRLSTILDMQNTAFILPVFDDFGQLNGIFPVLPAQCGLFRNKGAYWLKYTFMTGKQANIALADCGVMTKFQYRSEEHTSELQSQR